MANFLTTGFLNLRNAPRVEPGNVLAVMPPDTVVKRIDNNDIPGWLEVLTIISRTSVRGFASQRFLEPTDRLLPEVERLQIPAVHLPVRPGTIISRNSSGRAFPLNEPGLVKAALNEIGDTAVRSNTMHRVLDFLDVEVSPRYAPNSRNTFCNIYAYDVAFCLGAYLPRVWWTSEAIVKLVNGQDVPVIYDQTVTELSANRIFDWFEQHAASFGWTRVFDTDALQRQVNHGQLGIMVGQRVNLNTPGHIVAVLPETPEHRATRVNGVVQSPLQSQAGARNQQYFTGQNWWENRGRFRKFSFWYWSLE